MSATFTTTEYQQILNDYKIHLTGDLDSSPAAGGPVSSTSVLQNPPDWPTDRRRVPPHRPANTNLDFSERPRGSNVPEMIFLNMMFTGVFLNASIAQLWGKTGGPYFPKLFRYAIGGEW